MNKKSMAGLKQIEKEIKEIKERNKKVELDKKWETSRTRRVILFILTYMVVVIFFFFAGLPNPFLNAIVPSLAFFLSTLSLPFFRKAWLRYR